MSWESEALELRRQDVSIDDIHEMLKLEYPDLTRRQVRDYF